MLRESVVLLDERGVPIGEAAKADVHHADTPLHLGFSCYVIDPDDRLLVTRRSTAKRTFPGVWTNSFCGHPAPGETLVDAVRRRASDELGLRLGEVTVVLPDFRYRAEMDGVVELEICPVTVTRVADGTDPTPAADEVDDWQWVPWAEFANAVTTGARPVSRWCAEQVPLLGRLGPPRSWSDASAGLPPALRPPYVDTRADRTAAEPPVRRESSATSRQPSTEPLPGDAS